MIEIIKMEFVALWWKKASTPIGIALLSFGACGLFGICHFKFWNFLQ